MLLHGFPIGSFRHAASLHVVVLIVFLGVVAVFASPAAAGELKGPKWIVITSINEPTVTVLNLLQSEPDWNMVVVADLKSPKTWPLDKVPRTVYLTVEDQLKLPYETVKLLPYRHYARKNIGYLYAIEHGAEMIYDTDDDNIVTGRLHELSGWDFNVAYVEKSETLVNPYAYFGEPSLWPRGYPLSQIQHSGAQKYDARLINATDEKMGLWIRQSLANGDPDMDAIFRLTRKRRGVDIDVTFATRESPLVIDDLVPFNSQATMLMYNALWASVIPTNTTFRVCDIWRGYWAQRVLREAGGHLSFHSPIVVQRRNAHNYKRDFDDEQPLYADAERLVEMLAGWTVPRPPRGVEADVAWVASKLANAMFEYGFWTEYDALVIRTFMADLKKVGYRFPPLQSVHIPDPAPPRPVAFGGATFDEVQDRRLTVQTYGSSWDLTKVGLNMSMPWSHAWRLADKPFLYARSIHSQSNVHVTQWDPQLPTCAELKAAQPAYPKILLVVNFHWKGQLEANGAVLMKHIFPHYCHLDFDVVFVKPGESDAHALGNGQGEAGYTSYHSMTVAYKKYPNYAGYLLVNDDMLLDPGMRIDKDIVWSMPASVGAVKDEQYDGCVPGPRLFWWSFAGGCFQPLKAIDEMCHSLPRSQCAPRGIRISGGDGFYIPGARMPEYVQWAEAMLRHSAFLEFAVPAMVLALGGSSPVKCRMKSTDPDSAAVGSLDISLCTSWGGDRQHMYMHLGKGECAALHPVKLSDPVIRAHTETYYAAASNSTCVGVRRPGQDSYAPHVFSRHHSDPLLWVNRGAHPKQ